MELSWDDVYVRKCNGDYIHMGDKYTVYIGSNDVEGFDCKCFDDITIKDLVAWVYNRGYEAGKNEH